MDAAIAKTAKAICSSKSWRRSVIRSPAVGQLENDQTDMEPSYKDSRESERYARLNGQPEPSNVPRPGLLSGGRFTALHMTTDKCHHRSCRDADPRGTRSDSTHRDHHCRRSRGRCRTDRGLALTAASASTSMRQRRVGVIDHTLPQEGQRGGRQCRSALVQFDHSAIQSHVQGDRDTIKRLQAIVAAAGEACSLGEFAAGTWGSASDFAAG
jgi:hypothetical protein